MTLQRIHAAALCAVLLGGVTLPQSAAARTPDAAPTAPDTQLRLRATAIEPIAAPGGRFELRARFQREDSAGELREGGSFQLLGRFAKAGASCDVNLLFRSGFEG